MKILTLFLFFSASTFASVKIDAAAPDFKLVDEDNKEISLSSFKGKTVVLEWFNKDCPFVKKHYQSKNMLNLQKEFTKKGVVWLSVISSAEGKQGHISPTEAKKLQKDGFNNATHILIDSSGRVGKMYEAKTTPHMFIINKDGVLVYQGAIDSIPSVDQDDISKAKNFVKINLNQLLAGKPVTVKETTSYGCSVKY